MLRLITKNENPILTSYSTFGAPDFAAGMASYTYSSGDQYTVASSGVPTLDFLVPVTAGYFVWQPQSTSPIVESDLDSNEYYLTAPLNFTVEHDEGEYIVSFPEAELSRSGDSAQEALSWLKATIVDLYELYKSETNLGPLPKKQLAVFEKYIAPNSYSNRASRRA
jgi:hypothetical protein